MRDRLQSKLIEMLGNRRPWSLFPSTMAQRLSRGKWKPFRYLVEVSRTVVGAILAGDGRVLVMFPPRHGKTELAVIYLIIWFLELWPEKTVIFATYSEAFAQDQARTIRNMIQGNKQLLTIRLAQDSQSLERFHTVEGGGLITVGIGSGLAGLPADLLIIDDIFKSWEESQSPKARRKVIDWLTGTAYTRLQPKGSIVVVGARWHTEDLQGYLIDHHSDNWTPLNYPAVSEGVDIDPLGRPEGAPLAPELFDSIVLNQKREAIGPQKWAAQYMQNPILEIEEGTEEVFSADLISKIMESCLPPFKGMRGAHIAKDALHYIGIDIGKRDSHFATVICRKVSFGDPDYFELHVIYLHRYPLGTNIHKILEELHTLSQDRRFGKFAPIFVLDRSGSGGDLVLEIMGKKRMTPIIPLTVISTGKAKKKLTVPKVELVESLKDLISDERLRVPKRLPDAGQFFDELRSYRAQSSPGGRTTSYRPCGDGTDDFLDALGFVAHATEQGWASLWDRKSRRPIVGNRPSSGRGPLYSRSSRWRSVPNRKMPLLNAHNY
jgi:hypothetical protein